MFASIHIPRPSLQALLLEQPDKRYQPVVVLDEPEKITTSRQDRGKFRVHEISGEAAEYEIYRGMTAVQALARCDYLILLNRSPKAEARLTDALLDTAEAFTPDFEDTACGTCLLDLGGVAAVERDAVEIAQAIRERITSLEYSPCIGLAPNPDLAYLASRAASYRSDNEDDVLVLHEGEAATVLSPLPIAILDPEPALAELLELWGIRTIGEFTALKRDQLVDRLGEFAGILRDRATGKSRRLLRLIRPTETYSAGLELEYEVTTIEPLLFLMRRQLETIAARLRGAYLVAGRLSLRLDMSGGDVHRRVFRIPEPTTQAGILESLLQVHLEDFEARSPVCGFFLEAFPVRGGKHQFDLFAAGVKDPNRLAETLARVEAVLGGERFGVPRLKATHRADQFEMRPFRPEMEPVGYCGSDFQLEMQRLPIRQYRPRRHVQIECTLYSDSVYRVHSEKGKKARPQIIVSGDFKGRLTDVRGPFLSSGHWWEKQTWWKREEWDVCHENGRSYRLAKEKGEWFVEGVA